MTELSSILFAYNDEALCYSISSKTLLVLMFAQPFFTQLELLDDRQDRQASLLSQLPHKSIFTHLRLRVVAITQKFRILHVILSINN